MTKKYNYKDLDLYKAAKELVLSVYALLRKFPKRSSTPYATSSAEHLSPSLPILPKEWDVFLQKNKYISLK